MDGCLKVFPAPKRSLSIKCNILSASALPALTQYSELELGVGSPGDARLLPSALPQGMKVQMQRLYHWDFHFNVALLISAPSCLPKFVLKLTINKRSSHLIMVAPFQRSINVLLLQVYIFVSSHFFVPHLSSSTTAATLNTTKKEEVSRPQQRETFCCHPSLRTLGGGSMFGAAVSHPAAVKEVRAGGAGAVAFWRCMMCCDSGSRGWRAVTMRHHIAGSPGTGDQHAGLAKKC